MTIYAQVAVDVKHPDIKKEFTYLIPEDYASKIKKGDLVLVPFNRAKIYGVVVDVFSRVEPIKHLKIKSIIKREAIGLPEHMVELSEQIADYYGAAPIDFLKLMLPPKGSFKFETVYSLATGEHRLSSRAHLQKKIVEFLQSGAATAGEIAQRISANPSSIPSALSALLNKGYITKTQKLYRRKPAALSVGAVSKPINLTEEQNSALDRIERSFGRRHTVLLFGVTGSGKTEIYIRAIEKMINKGKNSILLVPEISLTPQIVAAFQSRFPGKVAVIHSRLSTGERFDEWFRIYSGEAKVVIGPRSAIFTPVRDLGLIIVDEEHESSYKQMEFPYYDARTIARMRADQHQCPMILGSATPSVDLYHRAIVGEYELICLTKRVSSRPLPEMEIVDMTEEMKAGHRYIFSRRLIHALKRTLEAGQQAILFLNRRGHSTFVICRDCGYILKCPHCDISLTYHFDEKIGKCHYCGYAVNAPDVCPSCRSRYIRYFGAGTEKIEQEVKRLFPHVRTLRIDSDTTSRKGSLEKMLTRFKKAEAQILVGTQVVAKGLDFPNVTLVGIISADTSLNLPDFRAGERTFQLITQVAGRAGRGKYPGKVFVQTYTPEALPIKAACENDIHGFYHEELESRRASFYPPYCFLLGITFSGPEEEITFREAEKIFYLLLEQGFDIEVFGPVPAPRPKMRGNYRYSILIKSPALKTITQIACFLRQIQRDPQVYMAWDVEPQDML